MRHFFLSYSPGDDDLYVARFFMDLSAAVRRNLDGSSDRDVGFLDDGNDRDRWPNDVRNELATCQTLLVLCTPKFFLNERCGQVWTVFTDRLRQYQRETGNHAPALIPVLWSGRGVPGRLLADGRGSLVAEPAIAADDVRVLVRLRSQRAAYQMFVESLALRVIETSRTHHIPSAPSTVDISTAHNAFDDQEGVAQTAAGPQYVHFVVAAGTRDQMRGVRHDVEFYGDRQEDWAPYLPAAAQPLASRARVVAAERLFGSEVVTIGRLGERIARAHERNEIIVVLVDAWAVGLETFRRALAAFDQVDETAVAVLVPANREDVETRDHRAELGIGVLQVFPHCARRRDPLFRTGIETPSGFDEDLVAALEEAQNRIFAKGRVFRRPVAGPANARPILEGPYA